MIGSISGHEKKVLRTRWYTKLATQRILSPKQKKEQKQLASKIKKCDSIQKRMQNDTNYHAVAVAAVVAVPDKRGGEGASGA